MAFPVPHQAILTDFKIHLPRFQVSQENTADWVYAAHQLGSMTRSKKVFDHYFVKPTQIKTRWVDIPDILNQNGEGHEIYPIEKSGQNSPDSSHGKNIYERALYFSNRALEAFHAFYPPLAKPPEHLIHVTCTGYSSPSAAQRLVASHSWIHPPKVTHAYHMGCYGALAALRIAQGMSMNLSHSALPSRVDLVHTELCSLHMNPLDHQPEQIVMQSLFADGYIKYSLSPQLEASRGFLILADAEKIIPESTEDMTWVTDHWGLRMTLSKHVPRKIAFHLPAFADSLIERSHHSIDPTLREAYFAVHPGGPKIIDEIQRILGLQDWQVAASREVLFHRGNMSSATLPHIWAKLLEQVPPDHLVVSLAFGPGLSLLGAVFRSV